MICTQTQIELIIKTNPNKKLIKDAQESTEKLMMLINGHGAQSSLKHNIYFENADIYAVRKDCAVSNKDMFGRLFQRESMVFTAQGGSAYYTGLNKEQTQKMDATIDNIRYSLKLRDWIKQFALPAFRCDPMGLIFMEVDSNKNVYPTYKSIGCIFDYQTTGRKVEYVCFQLTVLDLATYGITDTNYSDVNVPETKTYYYRLVDDKQDTIYKYESSTVQAVPAATQQPNVATINTLINTWGRTPAFVISDIISFENTRKFLSPIHLATELAATYMNDRSIRDLQKKYHGFLKAFEPLLDCGLCEGTGFLSGASCPECTPAGADKGTGYKLKTKVADIARFPLPKSGDKSYDINNYFGYVKLPIEVWDKQDLSLDDIEDFINKVYWGAGIERKAQGPSKGDKSIEETATKTLANLQPIYSRLNTTADWAEKTENLIADFIGQYLFAGAFKKSIINYGRYYILETPYELMEEYLEMKTKGASQSSLFSALKRYTHSMYCSDPAMLSVELKMINVEPFVHSTIAQVQANNPSRQDYFSKLYFSEWRQLQDFDYLVATDEKSLRLSLDTFATGKSAATPLEVPATIAIQEKVT